MDKEQILLKEKRTHGTAGYPLAVYDNYNRYPQFSTHLMDIHWHEEMEFTYVERGPMLFHLNDALFMVNTGQGIVIPPGVIHSAESVDRQAFLFQAVVFDLALLDNNPFDDCHQKFFKLIRDNRYHLTSVINQYEPWGQHVIDKLRLISHFYIDQPPGFELAIKSALYDIFFQYFLAGQIKKEDLRGTQHEIDQFKKVFEYIRKNYAEKIILETLAETAA